MSKTADLHTTFHTRIDVPATTRVAMGLILNERLADYLDLERQAKQAHWNVRGVHFQQFHALFDATAALAVTWADMIAERAVQLGCPAEGTLGVIAARSQLPEAPLTVERSAEWISVVAEALAFCANATRADIEAASTAGDAITADLLTRITGATDQQLWFVESHLEPEPR
jgi:starvation-inducible DNA-binding protein